MIQNYKDTTKNNVDLETCHELCTFHAHTQQSIGCCEYRKVNGDCYYMEGERNSIIVKDKYNNKRTGLCYKGMTYL